MKLEIKHVDKKDVQGHVISTEYHVYYGGKWRIFNTAHEAQDFIDKLEADEDDEPSPF